MKNTLAKADWIGLFRGRDFGYREMGKNYSCTVWYICDKCLHRWSAFMGVVITSDAVAGNTIGDMRAVI